jgi:endoplasmic reticulum-Golgi intermediate compartment protein 2
LVKPIISVKWSANYRIAFNFTHLISELSFGPLYPSLLNPLDHTLARTKDNFNRFQYYLSIVPTIYTRSRNPVLPSSSDPETQAAVRSRDTIFTNQYAVTQQSQVVPESTIPGIFFKFDIEPILLIVSQTRGDLLSLVVRIVNVVSGIMVGGGWIYQLWGWGRDNITADGLRRRARSQIGEGMLHGRKEEVDEGRMD